MLDDLPDDLVMDMATLALLNDSAPWRIAQETMPDVQQRGYDLSNPQILANPALALQLI